MRVLTSQARPSVQAGASSESCAVATHGTAEATLSELPSFRQRVGPINGPPLTPAFVRHMDDQTMVGLAAVFAALHASGLDSKACEKWGVVGAPRFLGRTTMTTALPKFLADGAWGVSPHTIPYFSLHSVAGAVSQALHLHGPNFGAGGGPNAEVEGLIAAIAMLQGHQLPGVWVVMTGWEPELIPAMGGAPASPSTCRAVALALTPLIAAKAGWRLTLSVSPSEPGRVTRLSLPKTTEPGTNGTSHHAARLGPESAPPKASRLQALGDLLNSREVAAMHWPLPGGGVLAWQFAD